MKKKQLDASVKEYKNETAAAIATIINAITNAFYFKFF